MLDKTIFDELTSGSLEMVACELANAYITGYVAAGGEINENMFQDMFNVYREELSKQSPTYLGKVD